MKNGDIDKFEGIKKEVNVKDNFFLLEDSPSIINLKQKKTESGRRLNDYDFNLLKEDAYKDVSDDLFKLEYKISKIEDEIKIIDNQIQSARDINDYNLIEELNYRKSILKDDYEALMAIYNDKSFSARLTDKVLNMFGGKFKNELNRLNNKISCVSDSIMSKMPKQITTIFELRKTLLKLENLNKSVDDLMSMNIPYGENHNKYDQLSKYIIKANSLQADISRYIKK